MSFKRSRGFSCGAWSEQARLPKEDARRAEDATPLIAALLAVIDAARAYLPPDGIGKDEFIARVLDATDNPRIVAALRSWSSGGGVRKPRHADN